MRPPTLAFLQGWAASIPCALMLYVLARVSTLRKPRRVIGSLFCDDAQLGRYRWLGLPPAEIKTREYRNLFLLHTLARYQHLETLAHAGGGD